MKKIIVIDGKWDVQSPSVQYAMKASKGAGTEIVGMFLAEDSSAETAEKAESYLKKVKQEFSGEGISFSSYVVSPEPQSFLKKIDDMMPASLVIIGDVKFSPDMVKGGASLEALRKRLSCPVTTGVELAGAHAEKKTAKGTNWGKWLLYAIGSALMYFVFYPNIKELNQKLFMNETVLGAIAIMAVVIVHAWVWGNTTHILPKLFKLEK